MTLPAGALIRDRRQRELGTGRVLEPRDEGFALVSWPEGEPREMRVDGQGDLVRALLHPGQRVCVLGEPVREGVILGRVHDAPHELWRYALALGGAEEELDEEQLTPVVPQGAGPLETLEALGWQGSAAFAARLGLLRVVSRWYENGFGIPALLGARIVPLPHQIHAARRVLTDRVPRFVLADEVGLGKTIEAGLILQALAAANPELRVLVVAPGAMSRQWLCELFLRFGEQVFVHIDARRLDEPDALARVAAPRLIVSSAALAASVELGGELRAQGWDLLVVDEAHQVHPDAPLYPLLRELAREAGGVLALSATPAKGDVRGLLGLLGLVAPEVYDPAEPERFAAALEQRDALAVQLDTGLRALERARADGHRLPALWVREQGRALTELLPHDAHVADSAFDLEDADELAELLAYVQENHRVDRRIIRTRRTTVRALGTSLCRRERVLLAYDPSPAERDVVAHLESVPAPAGADPRQQVLRGLYRRRAATAPLPLLSLLERRRRALAAGPAGALFDALTALGADPGPAEEEHLLARVVRETPPLPGEEAWLAEAIRRTHTWMSDSPAGCARARAALRWMRQERRGGGKLLVFAQEREVVEAFAETLRDELGPDAVGAIHHGLEEQQLSEVALRFQQAGGPCRVLVSDELGGEGRNFQVARAIVHLDQPWAVGRLEQRIGRLDRIGRDAGRPVRSAVLCGPSPSERALLALHAEVLDVYERSLGGLELLLPELQRRVAAAACEGVAALEALQAPLRARVAAERARGDEAYERALDASTRRLEEAGEQAEILAEVEGSDDALPLAAWAARLGVRFQPLGDELWSAGWSWEHLRRPIPGLLPPERVPAEGRVRRRGTFSRARALRDESLEFFAPGHPLVDAVVRDLHREREGRCAAVVRNLGPDHHGQLFLLVVARSELPAEALPSGLRYRAQAHLWTQARSAAVRLRPAQTPPAELVKERRLLAALEAADSSDHSLDPDDLARFVELPRLWAAARAGTELALASIATARQAEVQDATRRLGEELSEELAYLRGAAARAAGEERAELAAELAARERLLAAVAAERIELEALALVVAIGG